MSKYKIMKHPCDEDIQLPFYIKHCRSGVVYGRFATRQEALAFRDELKAKDLSLVPLQTPQGTEANKENNMNTTTSGAISVANLPKPYSVEQDRVDHFVKVRLPRIAMEKTTELEKFFGLVDDPHPRTWKELMDRIEKKQFVVNEEREALVEMDQTWGGYCPLNNVRFRDPAKVADAAGYKTAVEAMRTAMRETEDAIVAHQDDGEKILAALAAFEAKTFH